ncbi:sarcoplasmic/endoplasmic reticulum calcium ATPase regulator DWORF isoform X2 [Caloenas nicobarica]
MQMLFLAVDGTALVCGEAQVPLSRLVVPILLAVGWIVGCALMVYIVFS